MISHGLGDPLRVQRVRWQRTASLMAVGAYAQAQTLMEQVRSDLGDDLTVMDGPALSVYGSAHLRSAILAARAARTRGPGHAQQAWAHVDAARLVADHMGADRNDRGLAFGPSNVAQHEVAVAVCAAGAVHFHGHLCSGACRCFSGGGCTVCAAGRMASGGTGGQTGPRGRPGPWAAEQGPSASSRYACARLISKEAESEYRRDVTEAERTRDHRCGQPRAAPVRGLLRDRRADGRPLLTIRSLCLRDLASAP